MKRVFLISIVIFLELLLGDSHNFVIKKTLEWHLITNCTYRKTLW